jgi:DHA3 family multidrug efflux protein-like MFS transporter
VISGILVEIDGMFWVLLPALVVLVLALVHLAFVPVPAPAVAAPADEERRVDLRGTIRVVAEVPSSWSSRS